MGGMVIPECPSVSRQMNPACASVMPAAAHRNFIETRCATPAGSSKTGRKTLLSIMRGRGDIDGVAVAEFIGRLHLDFDANAKYVSFYVSETPALEYPEVYALNNLEQ